MKTTIVFDSEVEGDDLRMKQMLRVNDLLTLLWDYDNWLRSETKYAGDDVPEGKVGALYEARDKLYEMMRENNISFDELYP